MDKIQFLRSIFASAMKTIAEDIQHSQDRIIRRERFGDNASNFPLGRFPLRKHTTLAQDTEKYESNLWLYNEAQKILEMLDEADMNHFAKWFKENYK